MVNLEHRWSGLFSTPYKFVWDEVKQMCADLSFEHPFSSLASNLMYILVCVGAMTRDRFYPIITTTMKIGRVTFCQSPQTNSCVYNCFVKKPWWLIIFPFDAIHYWSPWDLHVWDNTERGISEGVGNYIYSLITFKLNLSKLNGKLHTKYQLSSMVWLKNYVWTTEIRIPVDSLNIFSNLFIIDAHLEPKEKRSAAGGGWRVVKKTYPVYCCTVWKSAYSILSVVHVR